LFEKRISISYLVNEASEVQELFIVCCLTNISCFLSSWLFVIFVIFISSLPSIRSDYSQVTVENICEDCDVKLSLNRKEMSDACATATASGDGNADSGGGNGFMESIRSLLKQAVQEAATATATAGVGAAAAGDGLWRGGVETLGGGSRMPLVQEVS
jgi:hypothetical protein